MSAVPETITEITVANRRESGKEEGMHKNIIKLMPVAAAIAALALPAQAALFDRGGGLIYDDVLDITWLQDANYAKTSGYDADGRMTWTAANTWAANLVYGGFDDWRLPTALNSDGSGPCIGFNCTSSEMGHLFYSELGAHAGGSILSAPNTAALALFNNVQSYFYWSGTAYAPVPSVSAWNFSTRDGGQGSYFQSNVFYAWAVRPGDVAAVGAVPEPETYAMLLAGLGVLAAARRRRGRLGASVA